MSKNIKIALWSLLALLLLVGLGFGLRFYRQVKQEVRPALSALTKESVLLLHIRDIAAFPSYLDLQEDAILQWLSFEKKGSYRKLFDSIQVWTQTLDVKELWLSYIPYEGKLQGIAAANVAGLQHNKLKRLLGKDAIKHAHTVSFPLGTDSIFVSFKEGVVLFAFQENLLRAAQETMDNGKGLSGDESLARVIGSSGEDVSAHLFLSPPTLSKFLEPFSKEPYRSFVSGAGRYSRWLAYDMVKREQNTLLSGYSSSDVLGHYFRDLLANESPRTGNVTDVLPSTTRFLWHLQVSNFSEFLPAFHRYLQQDGRLAERDSALEAISPGLSTLCEEAFSQWIGSEAAYFAFEDGYGKVRSAVALEIKDLAEATLQLERLVNYAAQSRSLLSVDKIQRLYLPDLLPRVFFDFFPSNKQYYFAKIGLYFFFAEEEDILTSIRMFFDQQKVLSKTPRLRDFNSLMQDDYSMNLYIQDLRNVFADAPRVSGGFQFSGHSGQVYNQAVLKYHDRRSQISDQIEVAPRKSTPLDKIREKFQGRLLKGPYAVKSHRSQDIFYFVQDVSNTLHFVNAKGEILWKKKLDGPLLSRIFPIDFLNNNKYQYLFNTKHQLYLLDFYGRNVGAYPVRFKIAAQDGIEVVDKRQNKDYQIRFTNTMGASVLLDKQARKIGK